MLLLLTAPGEDPAPPAEDAGPDEGLDEGLAEGPDAGIQAPAVEAAPAGLACLPTWYAGAVARDADGAWGLSLADGGWLPWAGDGGGGAGLEELYRTPYEGGPIVPLDVSQVGPQLEGTRGQLQALRAATFGETERQVARALVKVRFVGTRYPFHRKVAPALERVVKRLEEAVRADRKVLPFLKDIGGTFHFRRVARTQALSAHAFGVAIDLNPRLGHYWRWKRRAERRWENRVPQAVVDAFEAEGFVWGGRWPHFDTMHFEYRPEQLSPACRTPA